MTSNRTFAPSVWARRGLLGASVLGLGLLGCRSKDGPARGATGASRELRFAFVINNSSAFSNLLGAVIVERLLEKK